MLNKWKGQNFFSTHRSKDARQMKQKVINFGVKSEGEFPIGQ